MEEDGEVCETILAHEVWSACISKEQGTRLIYHVSRQKSTGNLIYKDVMKEFEKTMAPGAIWHEPGGATEQVMALMDKRYCYPMPLSDEEYQVLLPLGGSEQQVMFS